MKSYFGFWQTLIRVIQMVQNVIVLQFFLGDGQVSRLEQQCFTAETVELEIRDEIRVCHSGCLVPWG